MAAGFKEGTNVPNVGGEASEIVLGDVTTDFEVAISRDANIGDYANVI